MEREALARRAAEVADAVREGGPAAAARSLASRVVGGVTDSVERAVASLARAVDGGATRLVGTAAMVRMQWELPRGTVVGSMGRVSLAVGASALVLVAPGATEVATVQRLLREGSVGLPVLMLNPKLVDMQSTGYGLVGRELRSLVADTFEVAFCLKTLLGGALYRSYPNDWAVWREDAGAANGPALARALPGIEESPGGGGGASFLDGFAKFVKGFQAM
ncbi:hypothetical protein EMIHUDRAFT_209618 [Emiliania huxleyi CCMP1516]|uniref:DUF1995 domain-containing protein n=2 Tax=Emiliania huxleyi TaxID=2903 RepID=A0A0D3J2F9_EMIH1|nr:hypothetical protein EMIHUDRAFT_209618 [Emiliania huxleyi CCMP1516]EOD17694.1 hypothetical protein EMIHUDRAFT_209618 [Emiliania huxleyi CCMP1516]|eukprot:XP_005770123.1 hypothetical protein EMIHUDRAFT_209618 [Emiliania huxleyi CCMP1516]